MPKKCRIVTDPNLLAVAHLVAALELGTLTMHELADRCGFSYLTVNRYCAAFHRAHAVHIAAWKPDGRGAYTIRIYKLGGGVDAIAPIVGKQEKARRLRLTRAALRDQLQRGETLDPRAVRTAVALQRS